MKAVGGGDAAEAMDGNAVTKGDSDVVNDDSDVMKGDSDVAEAKCAGDELGDKQVEETQSDDY